MQEYTNTVKTNLTKESMKIIVFNSGVTQPEDRGIYLRDIIETGETDRRKSYCIDANYAKGGNDKSYLENARRQLIIKGFENNKSPKIQKRIKGNMKSLDDKGNCLLATCYKGAQSNGCTVIPVMKESIITGDSITWRKLTVKECERLQTVPDGYCHAVSNSRAYHALGNGWTVDVIAHILRGLK
jgi:site-specific DNA-cytosine methylase